MNGMNGDLGRAVITTIGVFNTLLQAITHRSPRELLNQPDFENFSSSLFTSKSTHASYLSLFVSISSQNKWRRRSVSISIVFPRPIDFKYWLYWVVSSHSSTITFCTSLAMLVKQQFPSPGTLSNRNPNEDKCCSKHSVFFSISNRTLSLLSELVWMKLTSLLTSENGKCNISKSRVMHCLSTEDRTSIKWRARSRTYFNTPSFLRTATSNVHIFNWESADSTSILEIPLSHLPLDMSAGTSVGTVWDNEAVVAKRFLLISTGATGITLAFDMCFFALGSLIWLQIYSTTENTATASSGEMVEAPPRSDLFRYLCRCSFLWVPAPGGMPEQHPCRMCSLMFLTASIVESDKLVSHLVRNICRLASTISAEAVGNSLSSPVSPSARKIKPNSLESCWDFAPPLGRVLTKRWQMW